jgi:hypothetical protein
MSFTGEEMFQSAPRQGEIHPEGGIIKENIRPENLTRKEREAQATATEQGNQVHEALYQKRLAEEAAASREAEEAEVRRRRQARANQIPSFNVSQPIPQQAIAASTNAVTEQFAALLQQLQTYRRQLFEIATASNITRRAILVSPDGTQIVYNPAENLSAHVKQRLSQEAKTAILKGDAITDEQFGALVNRITATAVMDDSFLMDLARRIRVNQDVFLSIKRDILAKKATIEDLNRSIRKVSDIIISLSDVYSKFTAPVEKTRETALAVRGYKPTVTVPVTPEGEVIPAKKRGFFSRLFGRGGRRTLKRRAGGRSKTSRLTRSRSRRLSSGGRAGTRRFH